MIRENDAEGRVAEPIEEALVGEAALGDQRDLSLEADLGVLADEPHGVGSEDRDGHDVGVAPDLRQVRHEIRDTQWRVQLLDDLAAGCDERPGHAPDVLVARREVGRDQDHLAIALLVRPFAERVGRLAVRERAAEDIVASLLLGEPVGTRVHDHEGHFLLDHVGAQRVGDGRLDDPAQDVGAVALHELPGLRQAFVRFVAARAFGQYLDPAAARSMADLAPVEEGAVTHVDTELSERSGVRIDDAELHRLAFLALGGGAHEGQAQHEQRPAEHVGSHRWLSLFADVLRVPAESSVAGTECPPDVRAAAPCPRTRCGTRCRPSEPPGRTRPGPGCGSRKKRRTPVVIRWALTVNGPVPGIRRPILMADIG